MFSVLRFSLRLFLHGKYTSALTSEIFFKNQIFKKMFFWQAVDPAFRRLGIGVRLLTEAILLARASGIGDVFLHVEQVNAPAVSMYEREALILKSTLH